MASRQGLNINAELPRIPKPSDNTWATAATSSTKAISDKRLFLRLLQEHEWHKPFPAGICEVIFKRLIISSSHFMGKIKPVHSGFALSPSSSEAREQILKAGNGLFLSGAKLESPAFIQMEKGQVESTLSCGNCGLTNHNIDKYIAAIKCKNCGGPHCAVSLRYLARPTHSGAPSKEQQKIYRQTGEREYQAVLRARIIEKNVATAESIKIDLTSSQIIEISSSVDHIYATPDEVSTGVAPRL
ncbi:hypothetical protein EPUL_005744 [Erysiphe pulchra]|uniref:Uncharacterized protein n=1 Tax=Erysiphe pulchra TaxID=225359 RepID=A0A2S4PJM5_9PEZI|nr:hypothetical protein EPUL_005744 [Erysiphe pulchra]